MHALIFCWQACRTNRTTIEPRIEPHNRRVEPVEPVEFQKSKTFTSSRFYWFYWFYTPVVWFYTWFYGGSIGSTRPPTKMKLLTRLGLCTRSAKAFHPWSAGWLWGSEILVTRGVHLCATRRPRAGPRVRPRGPGRAYARARTGPRWPARARACARAGPCGPALVVCGH
jgi:hypothetical protein